jgi:phage terminase Nu1 subunit (DNA packaging protein)
LQTDVLVSRDQLARLLGVSPGHVRRLQRAGLPGPIQPGGGRGRPARYDAVAAVAWQRAQQAAAAAEQDPEARTIRDQYLAALRDKVQLELRLRRGELLEADAVRQEYADLGRRVQMRIRAVPSAIIETVCGAVRQGQPAGAVHQIMLGAIDDALRELAGVPGAACAPEDRALVEREARAVYSVSQAIVQDMARQVATRLPPDVADRVPMPILWQILHAIGPRRYVGDDHDAAVQAAIASCREATCTAH